MEGLKDSAIKKPKRLTSVVWNHFERVRKAEACFAVCVHCNKKLSGSSNSGTTHLRNHLMRCLKRSNYDITHLFEAKRKKIDTSFAIALDVTHVVQRQDDCTKLPIVSFDQEQRNHGVLNMGGRRFSQQRSQFDLTCMILLHGYPLTMVEDVGFRGFVKNLQPLFEVVPNSSVELSCTQIYEKEKRRVHELINRLNGRVNLAVEKWSCPTNNHYLCLTAQFIDDVWKLQKKVLNFVTLETAHTEDMLSEVIVKCLLDWGIECKLFAMTFDDCSTDDDIVEMTKNGISQSRPFFSNGQLFDIRSTAHVVNLMVLDAIEALREVNQKIRESLRYVKSSREIQHKFNQIVQQVGIDCTKNLVLDSPSRWNSTYYMVETALHYKGAFCFLQEHDPAYTSVISETEWEWASSVTGYLKLFVEITNVFAGNKCPTANIYFPEICDVHIQLIEWCKSSDSFLSCMASKMKAKFDRHWSKCSLALAIAAILDPRFKMKLVEYYYSQIYGSTALDRIKEVQEGIRELFSAYSICSTLVDQGSSLPCSSLPGASTNSRDRLKGFDKFLHETSQSQSVASDLDKYLEEPVFPRNCDFNILNWWKVHTPRYPVLSMMARDVLGTPMSNVSLDMVFSTGGRMLDAHRSSLSPDILQALICTHDWLQIEQEGNTCLHLPWLSALNKAHHQSVVSFLSVNKELYICSVSSFGVY
ncbi:Zinc finger BED domain-containing protein RICESLEEPER 1 [Linum perenne]